MRRVLLALAAAALLPACATLKAPTLRVEALRVGKVGVTGGGLDVGFRVQNPNPDPLLIERFEYELKLNGRRLGRGYHADPLSLDGFRDARVASRFNLNFLSLPGALKAVLDQDRGRVEVKGKFYVRQGSGTRTLKFSSDANVDIGR